MLYDSIEQRYFKQNEKNNPVSSIEMWKVREMIKMVTEETILSEIVFKSR